MQASQLGSADQRETVFLDLRRLGPVVEPLSNRTVMEYPTGILGHPQPVPSFANLLRKMVCMTLLSVGVISVIVMYMFASY